MIEGPLHRISHNMSLISEDQRVILKPTNIKLLHVCSFAQIDIVDNSMRSNVVFSSWHIQRRKLEVPSFAQNNRMDSKRSFIFAQIDMAVNAKNVFFTPPVSLT